MELWLECYWLTNSMPCWWTANILLYPAPSKILGILSKPWQLSYLVLLSAHKPISNIFRVLGKTWHFYIFKSCYECAHTNCATTKAVSSSPPGRSVIDHLLDLVTKITAWLIMLTCKYTAAVSWLLLQLISRTWKCRCDFTKRNSLGETFFAS